MRIDRQILSILHAKSYLTCFTQGHNIMCLYYFLLGHGHICRIKVKFRSQQILTKKQNLTSCNQQYHLTLIDICIAEDSCTHTHTHIPKHTQTNTQVIYLINQYTMNLQPLLFKAVQESLSKKLIQKISDSKDALKTNFSWSRRSGFEDPGLHFARQGRIDGQDDKVRNLRTHCLHPLVQDLTSWVNLLLASQEEQNVTCNICKQPRTPLKILTIILVI